MRRFRRPTVAVLLGWMAAAVVATVVGLGGIRLVGESLTGTPGGVLTEDDVQRALAAGASPTASGAAPPASGETPPPAARPSGPLAARSSPPRAAATAGPPAEGSPGGGPAAGRTTTGEPAAQPTTATGGRPAAPRTTATSKMGNAPTKTRTTNPPPARGVEATFSTSGGTAIARCTGDEAYLVSWSPRPGYSVDKAKQGPDDEVEVRFEGDEGRSEMKISCSNGTPVAETKDD